MSHKHPTGAGAPAFLIAADELHVWSAFLDALPADCPSCFELLAPDEQQRAERLRMPKVRERFILTHALLRRLLAAYLDADPQALVFSLGPHGKPSLAAPPALPGLRFNLSHSGDLLLVAIIGDQEVGIDLEQLHTDCDVLAIADRYFSCREAAALRALPLSAQREAFYRAWTRKEAYAKGRGEGMTLPFNRFSVTLAPGAPAALTANEIIPADVGRWQLADLAVPEGYVAAVATTGRAMTIVGRQWTETGHTSPDRGALSALF